MAIIRIEVRPNTKSVRENDIHYSGDGFMRDHDLGERKDVRVGTAITMTVMDVAKTIAEKSEVYYKIYRASKEVNFDLEGLGMARIEMPSTIPARLGIEDLRGGIVHKYINDMLEPQVIYFQVYVKGSEVVVAEQSTSPKVSIEVDRRFPKYFSGEKFVYFSTTEEIGFLADYARELYAEHQGITLQDSSESVAVDEASAGFTLGDLAMFAPKKQRK